MTLHHYLADILAAAWALEVFVSLYWKRRCLKAEKVRERFIPSIVVRRDRSKW